MSLKRRSSIFRTVKFRIALLYAVLFTFSSAVLFLLAYYFLLDGMMRRIDENLVSFSDKLEDYYLKGETLEERESSSRPARQVPQNIVALAEKSVRGLLVVRKEHILKAGIPMFELTGVSGKTVHEITVNRNGDVIETKSHPVNEISYLERKFVDEAYYEGARKLYFLLASPGEKILAKSDLSSWPGLKVKREMLAKVGAAGSFRTDYNPKLRCKTRIFDRRIFDGNVLEVGAAFSTEENVLAAYSSIFLSISAFSLLLGSLTGWFVAGRSIGGIDRITRAAVAAGQGDFSKRVPYVKEGVEIENLVISFNEMLAKIETLIRELKEITDNIAHDLRTPLTRIRGAVETTVNGNPSLSDYRGMAGEIVEECDRLVGMINTMLEISRADSGMLPLERSRFDLVETAQSAFKLFAPSAEMKGVDFRLEIPRHPLFIEGDVSYLQRALANLLDNAIKYTPERGLVLLSVSADEDFVNLAVSDTGCGISKDELPKVFERFYRCDSSRSQPGNGLGLSLARAIIRAHGSEIALDSIPGKGSTFSFRLPRM